MAADYDAPRETDAEQTIPELADVVRAGEADDGEADGGWELPAETLTGDDTVVVLPAQDDEFTCVNCFLVKNRTQYDHTGAAGLVCRDCAADE